jgi:hypothetical protein
MRTPLDEKPRFELREVPSLSVPAPGTNIVDGKIL